MVSVETAISEPTAHMALECVAFAPPASSLSKPFRRSPVQWAVALLVLAVGAAVMVSFWATIGKPDCQDMDYGAYYRAAVAVGHGESPYTLDREDDGFPPRAARVEGHGPLGAFPYAPAYAYLFLPLSYFDYLWGCRAWLVVNWLATVLAAWVSGRLVTGETRAGNRTGILFLTVLVMAGYLWANIRLGQIATLMVLGCLAWAWLRSRGYCFAGGLCLAAATALKLAPLAFVPYLVLKRDGRGLMGFAAGALTFFLLPICWVGWNGNLHLHGAWLEQTRKTDVPIQTYRPGNQSLLAEIARLPPFGDGHHCFSLEKLERLKQHYPFLLVGLLGLLYAWMHYQTRTANRASQPGTRAALLEIVLVFLFMTLGHPHAWRCDFVGLLLPCAVLAKHVIEKEPGRLVAAGALTAVVVACLLPTHGIGEHGWNILAWLILGKHFWAGVAVGAACLSVEALTAR